MMRCRYLHTCLGAAVLWLLAPGVLAQANGSYELPLPGATEWKIVVFGARFPEALSGKPVPFTIRASWQANGEAGGEELTGEVSWLKTAELSATAPAGCSSLAISLDWEAPGVDLDLGLSCTSPQMRLAPIFTVLKPERVRLDAQTAPFYKWLASAHPDWWKGYPFWAEVEPGPRPGTPKGSG
jgi:hypothetical protein